MGVFAEPKDAKAPEPRPKALDAPVVGEAREEPPGVVAAVALKGSFLPWEEVAPPNLLEKEPEPLRAESPPVDVEVPWLGVERESLPELWHVVRHGVWENGERRKWVAVVGGKAEAK